MASMVTLEPIVDGDVSRSSFNTEDASTSLYRSGGACYKSIFEFDLSFISNDITLTGAEISLYFSRFFAVSSWLPVTINFYAYAGDGTVTLDDYTTEDSYLVGSVIYDTGQENGTQLVLSFDTDYIQRLLDDDSVDYVSIRAWCTNSFFNGSIASLENSIYDAATLTLTYTSVPIPTTLFLLSSGVFALSVNIRRRNV
nr:hypothetical protein [uncultured Desulfobacter sp.]